MALKNRDNNKQYVRLTKEGKFTIGKEGTPYEELEGTIVAMRYKDEEYQGTPIRKLYTTIQDEDGTYDLGISVDSPNYTSLVGFLKNVDLSRPVTLHPKVETQVKDGKESTRRSVLVSQDGKYAKGYFTQASGNTTPEWKKVKIGKTVVIDKTEYLDFYEAFVKENFISKLGTPPVINKKEESSLADDEQVETSYKPVATGDGLPWDEDEA